MVAEFIAREQNRFYLHDLSRKHSELRREARWAYRPIEVLKKKIKYAQEVGNLDRVPELLTEIERIKPIAARKYAEHKKMEKKLLALWDKYYQRFPVGPKPSALAISLDMKREAYRETWGDPYHGQQDEEVFVCLECQRTKESSYQVTPVCRNPLCSREGEDMEPEDYYELLMKPALDISTFPDGSMKVNIISVPRFRWLADLQESYQQRAEDARKQEEERLHNQQIDLDNLRRMKKESRLFKRIQQYRNRTTMEPELVAA
jgi:hypothetical protein